MFSFLFGGRELVAIDAAFDVEQQRLFTPELSTAQRNCLIAHWVADTVGVTFAEAAGDLPRLFGLAFGRPRLGDRLIASYPNHPTYSVWGDRWLRDAFEVEMEIGARLIVASVPLASLEYVASRMVYFEPPTPTTVARKYFDKRHLLAFGGEPLDTAVMGAVANDLQRPLTPVAPFGPIRLQVRKAIKELADPALLPRLL